MGTPRLFVSNVDNVRSAFQPAARHTMLSPSHNDHHRHHPNTRAGAADDLARRTAGLSINTGPSTPQRPTTLANPTYAPSSGKTSRNRRGELSASMTELVSPTLVLLDKLMELRVTKEFQPSLNKVAKRFGFHRISWNVDPWPLHPITPVGHQGLPVDLETMFVKAVVENNEMVKAHEIKQWSRVKHHAQVERTLDAEAAVADSISSNVINPLLELFYDFIHPTYAHLHCTIRSQWTHRERETDSKLDHVVFLEEHTPLPNSTETLKIPLVIIEEKAPGIVDENDWHPYKEPRYDNHKENWMHVLLPQLFLYAHRMQCPRLFLTDYTNSWGVHVNSMNKLNAAVKNLEANGDQSCNVQIDISVADATREHEGNDLAKHPYEYGFRFALAFEVFLALRELGVSDDKLVHMDLPTVPLDLRIARFNKHHHYAQQTSGAVGVGDPESPTQNLHLTRRRRRSIAPPSP